jgi:hypothetical protein
VTPDDGKKLIEILKTRDTLLTKLEMNDGKILDVWNIAWGYSIGDDFAHVTTNISPDQEDYAIDCFYTNEVTKVVDAETGYVIIQFS